MFFFLKFDKKPGNKNINVKKGCGYNHIKNKTAPVKANIHFTNISCFTRKI